MTRRFITDYFAGAAPRRVFYILTNHALQYIFDVRWWRCLCADRWRAVSCPCRMWGCASRPCSSRRCRSGRCARTRFAPRPRREPRSTGSPRYRSLRGQSEGVIQKTHCRGRQNPRASYACWRGHFISFHLNQRDPDQAVTEDEGIHAVTASCIMFIFILMFTLMFVLMFMVFDGLVSFTLTQCPTVMPYRILVLIHSYLQSWLLNLSGCKNNLSYSYSGGQNN